MIVSVDEDRCRGHGVCTALCPVVFALNDDGYSEVLTPEVPAAFEDAVRDAVRQCPEKAIGTTRERTRSHDYCEVDMKVLRSTAYRSPTGARRELVGRDMRQDCKQYRASGS